MMCMKSGMIGCLEMCYLIDLRYVKLTGVCAMSGPSPVSGNGYFGQVNLQHMCGYM